jgi:VWFA-related protein
VRVVNLEVEVFDRDGLSVTGLGPADFELTVDGERLPIRYFTEIRGGTAVAAEASTGEITAVPDLVAGEPVGTNYLVFVDDFFPLARDRDRVLQALRDDVGRLKPEDRMAIVAFDGNELTMLSTWTNSARELERTLRDATRRPSHGLRRLSERRSLASDRAASRTFPGIERRRLSRFDTRLDISERFYAETLEQQLDNMVSAVAAALRGFANPPGRKVLLLFAGGWPFDVGEFVTSEFGRAVNEPGVKRGRQLFAPIIDTANQVGYSIFAVDVPGLAASAGRRGAGGDSEDATSASPRSCARTTSSTRCSESPPRPAAWRCSAGAASRPWLRPSPPRAPTTGSASRPPGRGTTGGTRWRCGCCAMA